MSPHPSLVATYLTVLTILAVSSEEALSDKDIVYVGCYATNVVETQLSYYKIREVLPWEKGIAACNHRYTTHVGVQTDNSTNSESYFFCGNDLLEHSIKVEDSACAPCVNRSNRSCGAPDALSIYKIRDRTPLVIYLAGNKGIIGLEFNGSHTNYSTTLTTPSPDVCRFDLFYSKDKFILASNFFRRLSITTFDHQQGNYSTPSSIGRVLNGIGVAFDWLHDKIYFFEGIFLTEYDMTSNTTTRLFSCQNRPSSKRIQIDPYDRMLFVVFVDGSLISLSLRTKETYTYKGGETLQQNARDVAVDFHNQMLYVVVSQHSERNVSLIVSLDYADTVLTQLYEGPAHTMLHGLDVFNTSLVWINEQEERKTKTVSVCSPSPSCIKSNMHTIEIPTTADVSDILIYHPLKQTPTEKYMCESAGCSHKCMRVALFSVRCSCPEGLTLSPDNTTCQDTETSSQDTQQITWKTRLVIEISILELITE